MKAVRIHSFGGPDRLILEDAPVPDTGPDEILVRVHGAGVNPVDWKIREGHLRPFAPPDLPMIIGWDASGTVERVGILVTRFNVGDAVFARPDMTRNGAYAEYVVVKADEAAHAPRSLMLLEAASIPLSALTAWMALFDKGRVNANKTVLIHAASGGVGLFAVQLAKLAGATVIGTTSSVKREFVQSLGADRVICYDVEEFDAVCKDVDVVFDTLGGRVQEKSFGVLKPGGVMVSVVGQADHARAEQFGVSAAQAFVTSNGARLEALARLVDAHRIRTIVTQVFDLSEAAVAHALSQTGHVSGKLVLKV